ncbi:MAG: BRCT domain-containing protein [Bacteroidetes bacterium]|nr:BRCT domain-containing protein [Bacteroidota bacterium]
MDQIKETSKLTSSNHSRCVKKAGKCHVAMLRAGFTMRDSCFIDYGFQIKYQKGTELGFFRIYINKRGVARWDYCGVPFLGTIQQLRSLIRDNGTWELTDKESIPAKQSRKILNWRHSKGAENIFVGHEKITGGLLKPDLELGDKSHLFYNKKVVFTGVLDRISRGEAAKIVKEKGADIDTGITKNTHFVIVGHGAGPTKLMKIQEFNSKGSNIRMLSENEFLDIITPPQIT